MDNKQKIAVLVAMLITFGVVFYEAKQNQERLRYERARQQKKLKREAADKSLASRKESSSNPSAESNSNPVSRSKTTLSLPASRQTTIKTGSDKEADEVADTIIITTDNFWAELSSRGASLRRFTLRNFYRTTDHKPGNELTLLDEVEDGKKSITFNTINNQGGLANWNYRILQKPEQNQNQENEQVLTFQTVKDYWQITKTYRFAPQKYTEAKKIDLHLRYGFRLEIAIKNLHPDPRVLEWEMQALSGFLPDDTDSRYGDCKGLSSTTEAATDSDSIKLFSISNLVKEPVVDSRSLAFLGFRGRFFATVLRTENIEISGGAKFLHLDLDPKKSSYLQDHKELLPFVAKQPHSGRVLWSSRRSQPLSSGQSQTINTFFYGGPIEEDALQFEPLFTNLVSYSFVEFFEPISTLLVKLLNWVQSYVANYGIAIILMTLIIKTALHGLTRKGLASGHKMQKVQPLMKEMKEKYKDNREKLQQETMKIWREHGVSPWGSCLPMLIQIPIFISLFGVFAQTFAMRQALFIPGWIEDLSQPDALFSFGANIPLLGTTFNLLPILYVALQLIQQSMTPKSNDPQMAQQQAMMKFMPIIFMFIFYNMPSGLVLYFTISAGYTLVEHWLIRRQLDGPDSKDAGKGGQTVGAGAGMGFKKKTKK